MAALRCHNFPGLCIFWPVLPFSGIIRQLRQQLYRAASAGVVCTLRQNATAPGAKFMQPQETRSESDTGSVTPARGSFKIFPEWQPLRLLFVHVVCLGWR